MPIDLGAQHRYTYDHLAGGVTAVLKDERLPVKKVGTQITESEGHPFLSRSSGEKGDLGGEFYTTRQYIEDPATKRASKFGRYVQFYTGFDPVSGQNYQVERTYQYDGPILPVDPATVSYPPTLESSNARLNELGATAVARCKPTNSVADVSTFLGETLREGVPKLAGSILWRNKVDSLRKRSGSEYLNVQFGWLPFVADVKDIAKAITHAESVLTQYERDAGKQVRRRYEFPPIKESTTSNVFFSREPFGPGGDFMGSGSNGTVVRTREKVQRQWFSGAFTYYLPTGYDSRSEMSRHALQAKKLFGLTLTPEVVWNLTPWSWAVDWFSNAGDVTSNLSDWAVDGLVMRYGYIMEHTVVRDTYTLDPYRRLLAGLQGERTLTLVTETKIRRKANPFGFGVSWEGLSARQLSIAAALGLTRT